MVIDRDDAAARLRRIVELIESKDYYAVGGSRRFLAAQRRRTWDAARTGSLVVAAAALALGLALSMLHPAQAGFLVVLNSAFGMSGLVAWWVLAHGLRRRPELVAFLVGLGVLCSAMAVALGGPHLVEIAIAYLMILPTIIALVVPWRTWTEVRWLAAYAAIGAVFLTFVPATTLSPGDRSDLVVVLITSLLASFTGHVLLFRGHVRTFSQMQAIASLHRRENSQRVELERVYRSLEITARTDELTRVGNRLKFDEDLVAVRARIGRTGRPIGLVEIDLDHFKAVNDLLGHLAGDTVLRAAASAIHDAVRAGDSVFRSGGEEFMVITSGTDAGVQAAAERIRRAVENLGLTNPGNLPFGIVTVSIGAATLGPADLDQTADQWFARVDSALYEAKSAGRNQVAIARGRSPVAGLVDEPTSTGRSAA